VVLRVVAERLHDALAELRSELANVVVDRVLAHVHLVPEALREHVSRVDRRDVQLVVARPVEVLGYP